MRHRLANNGLSRTTSHRMLMLRNLVSSLLEHEQIHTTVAKAKEAQRLAEQCIQWGKRGRKQDWDRANLFLLNPQTTLRRLFGEYATRYASRPGGYTRVVRAGFRQGDRAPIAVLELVDNRNDVRLENAAKTVGREMAVRARNGAGPDGWWTLRRKLEANGPAGVLDSLDDAPELHPLTRQNVEKALRYKVQVAEDTAASATLTSQPSSLATLEADEQDQAAGSSPSPLLHPAAQFLDRSYHHYLAHLAQLSLSSTPTPDPERTVKQLTQRLKPSESRGPPKPVLTVPLAGRLAKAGQRTDGWSSAREVSAGADQLQHTEAQQRGGPISRAKFSRSRNGRRSASQAGPTSPPTTNSAAEPLEAL